MSQEESKSASTNVSGGGRNINHVGMSYIENGVFNNSGTSQINFGQANNMTNTSNQVSNADVAKLQEYFSNLNKVIDDAPNVAPEDKEDAKAAAKGLQEEVEAVKKDPEHKPDRLKMKGFIAAFQNVGVPVIKVASTIIGFPALGEAINQFAKNLPTE